MSKRNSNSAVKMVATKSKHKVISCSTPEQRSESPSRDSDSLCDSEAASPVPFLCTQDGAEGETDVVWNYYTPKADRAPSSRIRDSTPLSRKSKKSLRPFIEKPLPKRRAIVKASRKKTELFQDLIELNQNLHDLIAKKSKPVVENPQSGSEEDIFSNSGGSSPRSGLRTNSRCLRKNVLSSKFSKPDPEAALESDDSMNECLIKASQVVEENILHEPTPQKKICLESSKKMKPHLNNINMDNDSMDAILKSIKLESPLVSKTKKYDSPKLNNDSFDSLVGKLNDSALERLTQMPVKPNTRSKVNTSYTDWTVQELIVHDGSPLNKSGFGRHNSMPESPSVPENKPSTSGMVFGRYNSMPYEKHVPGDSPIRCTQDEIKRKHQLARERLLAKRLLPFTSSLQTTSAIPSAMQQKTPVEPTTIQQRNPAVPTLVQPKNTRFQPKVASAATVNKVPDQTSIQVENKDSLDIKSLIERKRQEALMKLRRRQPQNKQ